MKSRSIFYHLITTFIVITLTSCSILPMGNNDDISDDDLLGEWEYLSSENGSADLAHDIVFLSNGKLRITEIADLLVEEYQYEVIKPGRIRLSALGVEREVKFEINGDQLKLNFDSGYNLYKWIGGPRGTQPLGTSTIQAPTLLNTDTPVQVGTPETVVINREIINPESAERVIELTRFGNATINQLAWSPDGSMLASADDDGTVRLWDASTNQLSYTMKEHRGSVLCVAFSPDGKIMASGGWDGTLRLWDTTTGKQLSVPGGHYPFVLSTTFSPDGRTLASGGSDDTVKLWDVASGELINQITVDHGDVFSIAFSPDGSLLASGSYDGNVSIWDITEGKLIDTLQGINQVVYHVTFSSDGQTLATGGIDNTVRLWDLASRQQLSVFRGHRKPVREVAFSPDNRLLVSTGEDKTVRLWDVASGQQLHVLKGHGDIIRSVAFSPDGRFIASGGDDGTIRLWGINFDTAQPMETLQPTSTESSNNNPTVIAQENEMHMMYIPAGEFLMGSPEGVGDKDEHPQHTIYLDSFYIDETEVTNAMFDLFVAETKYQTEAEKAGKSYAFVNDDWLLVSGADWQHPFGPNSDISGLGDHPVIHVSWNDAAAYCEWAGKRLPTEAEWEKAARGTDGATYPWGNDPPAGDLVNYADGNTNFDWSVRSVNDGYKFTSPVGNYPDGASPYGLLDVAGNVWEWVADWYGKDYYSVSPERNPQGPASGTIRVMRGGAWDDLISGIRSTYRAAYAQNNTNGDTGFRCASSEGN